LRFGFPLFRHFAAGANIRLLVRLVVPGKYAQIQAPCPSPTGRRSPRRPHSAGVHL